MLHIFAVTLSKERCSTKLNLLIPLLHSSSQNTQPRLYYTQHIRQTSLDLQGVFKRFL